MNLISSNLVSKYMAFVILGIEYSIWLIGPLSLFLLSVHHFKQLTSPFKEGVELNGFRNVTIVSKWFLSSIIGFLIIGYKSFIKYEVFIEILYHISECTAIVSICSLNILIIYKFKLKLTNNRLNKNNFKNEKKAILCKIFLNLHLLITWAPVLL